MASGAWPTVLESRNSSRRPATPFILRKNPTSQGSLPTSRSILAMIFLTTLFVGVFLAHLALHAKPTMISNCSHQKLKVFSWNGSFFSPTHPIHSPNKLFGARPRYSAARNLVYPGSLISLNGGHKSGLGNRLDLIRNAPKHSTDLLWAVTSKNCSRSSLSMKFLSGIYITWTRKAAREEVGAKHQV
jgi:hypothetical protein